MGRIVSSSVTYGLNDKELRAVEMSHLRSLPSRTMAELATGATRLRARAGSTMHREGDSAPHLRLVVSGLVRVYMSSRDGRTLTVRYCRTGSLLGVISLFASSFSLPASIQAVTDAELLALPPSPVRQAAERDVQIARALIDELTERVLSFIGEIPGVAFTTVRQRVARHLLDLASGVQTSRMLVAAISQQELADAVGTVREVVVRALRELREVGLVRTERDRIVLLDPERLAEEGYAAGWNKSR